MQVSAMGEPMGCGFGSAARYLTSTTRSERMPKLHPPGPCPAPPAWRQYWLKSWTTFASVDLSHRNLPLTCFVAPFHSTSRISKQTPPVTFCGLPPAHFVACWSWTDGSIVTHESALPLNGGYRS